MLVLLLLLVGSGGAVERVPTLYDVLQLVYTLCSTTGEGEREERLACAATHLGAEVSPAVSRCLSPAFCRSATHVPQWAAKHTAPPPHLTRVLGLSALGRMGCVLEEVRRPLPAWRAAFQKCFPDFQSNESLRKDRTKNRSENSLVPDR